jgi:hypothetical protein
MRVMRAALTAAFSAALFGTTTPDIAQAADAVRLNGPSGLRSVVVPSPAWSICDRESGLR